MSSEDQTKKLIQMSDVHWKNGKRQESIDTLADLIEKGETNVVVHFKLAERLGDEKQFEEQISVLNQAIRVLNDHHKTHSRTEELIIKAYLHMSVANKNLNQSTQARECLLKGQEYAKQDRFIETLKGEL